MPKRQGPGSAHESVPALKFRLRVLVLERRLSLALASQYRAPGCAGSPLGTLAVTLNRYGQTLSATIPVRTIACMVGRANTVNAALFVEA